MTEAPQKRSGILGKWDRFKEKHPTLAQFVMFFIISNGVTVLQLALMPLLRGAFAGTALTYTAFQVFPVGTTVEGARHYIFNYPAGSITPEGIGGGLAYFLAVQITIGIAQIINFFAQRNITFKANNSMAKAAMWYVIAYIAITFAAGAAQGLYKAPIYSTMMGWWGGTGETVADVVTMIINAAISFWIFFPIFKLIFKNKPIETTETE
jgi:putative flippase GtrA